MTHHLLAAVAVTCLLAGAAAAQPAPPPAEPAPAAEPANTGARGFKSEGTAPAATPRTPEQALDRCIADVERLERDAIGVPYLAAAYLAFFVILAVFFVLVRRKQRRMEEEMRELTLRLARLQAEPPPARPGGPAVPNPTGRPPVEASS